MYQRLLIAASMAAASSVSASVYITDFGAPSGANAVGQKLDGLSDNGTAWSQNALNSADDSPSAFVGAIGSSKGAAVGGFYDVPGADPFKASRAIGVPLANTTLDLNFAIQDSTTDFAFRNDFSITVASGMGGNLFTLGFSATDQLLDYDTFGDSENPLTSNSVWNMSWTSDVAGGAANFAAVGEDTIYGMALSFTPDGADMDFSLSVQGTSGSPFVQTGTLTGVAGGTLANLDIGFTQGLGADWGDNFIVVQGVPEPSALLLVGASAFGLLRRRRR
jgi:hypothetical protein